MRAALALWIPFFLFPACEQGRGERVDWELQRHYQAGNQAVAQGNPETAERMFRRVLRMDD